MSLRHMEFAVKISELKSFTKAASELGIAQPSLSKSIMLLEKELGIEIFDRKNGLELTYAGEIYIARAKNMLRLNKELDNEIRGLSSIKTGKLVIGATSTSFKFIEKIIAMFYSRFSKADIRVVHAHSEPALIEMLKSGELDIVYAAHFGELSAEGLECEFIKKRRLLLSVCSSHPAVSQASINSTERYPKIALSEFKSDKFAISSKILKSESNFKKIFENAGFTPQIFCDTSYLYVANAMVAAGLCVSFSFARYIFETQKDYITLFDVADEPLLDVSFSVVYKKPSKLAKEFIKMIKAGKSGE